MLLLIDARKLGEKPSGIGMYIYNYINGILRYDDVDIILVSDIYNSIEIKELKSKVIKTYEYGKSVKKNLDVIKYYKYIQKIINYVKPYIFWEPNNIIPVKLKNKYGKILMTIHDIFPISNGNEYSYIYKKYFKYSMVNTLKSADNITCVSGFTKNELEEYYGSKVVNKKIFVSYNIVDFTYENSSVDMNYFLYIGNVEKRKGVDILLKSYKKYRDNGGQKGLHIAGAIRDEELHEQINVLAKQYSDVFYLGYISSEDKEKQLKECSAFVFPSRAEGFGIPPVEALSYGKQVIVSDLDVFKEVLCQKVEMFELSHDENRTVDSLTDKLFGYENRISKDECDKLLERYSSQTVVDKFVCQLRNL